MKRLVLVVVSLLAAASLAQSGKPEKPEGKKVERKQILIFTPDLITGEADSPNGVVIETIQRPEFPSFFKVRENFDDKLRESINEL